MDATNSPNRTSSSLVTGPITTIRTKGSQIEDSNVINNKKVLTN